MSFRSLAVAAIAATANAHMIMKSPVPFSVDMLDNSPISAEQYPCKHQIGYKITEMNKMAVGEKLPLTFTGSAVHGGGSCQLAVTTDLEPTKDSVFKVIKSIEGECPGVDGAADFSFELPDSIPNGKATFAWTWFAKLSGGPEMYMNCAPIEVTGGASDKSKFEQLPDMLIANIGTASCKSPTSKVLKFPNPGKNLEINGNTADILPGDGCGEDEGTSPADSSQPSPPAEGAPSPTPTPPAEGVPTPPTEDVPSPTPTTPASEPSAPAAPETTPALSAAPEAPGYGPGNEASTSTTLVTITGTPTLPTGTAPAGTGSPAKPTKAPAAPGTCTTEGEIVCNGESQFGLCNHGKAVFQPVAAGTKCTNGKIARRNYNGRIVRPRIIEKY